MINNEWDIGLKAIKKSKRAPVCDLEEAASLVSGALDTAARQLLGPDVVLLSGDVDSLLIATAAMRAKRSPLLVTAAADKYGANALWSEAVANHLGLDLLIAPITPEASGARPSSTADAALANALRGVGAKYAWSASGADILFAPYQDQSSPLGDLRSDWEGRRELIERTFSLNVRGTRFNSTPALRHIGLSVFGLFEGAKCLVAASRLAPEVLNTHVPGTQAGTVTSKAPLRALATAWGVPAELCFAPQSR